MKRITNFNFNWWSSLPIHLPFVFCLLLIWSPSNHPVLEREDRLRKEPFAGFGTVMEDINRTSYKFDRVGRRGQGRSKYGTFGSFQWEMCTNALQGKQSRKYERSGLDIVRKPKMLGWVAHCSIIHYPAQLSSPRCTAPSWHDLLDYHLQPTLNFSTVKLDFKILHWFPSCLCYCCLVLLNAIIVTFFWQPSLYTNTIWSFSWRREGGAECHGRPDGVLNY